MVNASDTAANNAPESAASASDASGASGASASAEKSAEFELELEFDSGDGDDDEEDCFAGDVDVDAADAADDEKNDRADDKVSGGGRVLLLVVGVLQLVVIRLEGLGDEVCETPLFLLSTRSVTEDDVDGDVDSDDGDGDGDNGAASGDGSFLGLQNQDPRSKSVFDKPIS